MIKRIDGQERVILQAFIGLIVFDGSNGLIGFDGSNGLNGFDGPTEKKSMRICQR